MGAIRGDFAAVFGQTLVELGTSNDRVVVVDSDLADSCKTEEFNTQFPDRTFDLGIAEQSLPTFSAGMALAGLIPIYNSFAAFAVHRGVDMIRQSIAYNRANVKIVGHSAGQSMGYTGPSHHTIEDIALMRAIPGMTILCPSDTVELRQMMYAMVAWEGPVYLRMPRGEVEELHTPTYRFSIGRIDRLRDKGTVAVFATGDVVGVAMSAAQLVGREGIDVQVVNVPTIKPVDSDAIIAIAAECDSIITVEDHSIIGGLGGMISELLSTHAPRRVVRIGIPDRFTESDEGSALRERYGISEVAIAEELRRVATAGKW